MKKLFLLLSLLFSFTAFAAEGGSGAGNGGDTVRMSFFSIGNNMIDYYHDGFKKIKSVVKNPEELRNYLNISVVSTSVELLLDNRGNPVNAIGEKNKIILYVGEDYSELSWTTILKDQRSAQKLILHEMLRAHGVNDDNYIYSNVVLYEQDIVEGQGLKLKWSQDSLNVINSAQIASLNALSPSNELAVYEKALDEIKKFNNLPYAKVLSLQVKLSEGITKNSHYKTVKVPLLRRDLKNTKGIIPMVDKVAYAKIKQNKSLRDEFNKIALLVLKDFSLKCLEYPETENAIFSENLSEISKALNSDEGFQHSCNHVNDAIDEAQEILDQKGSKRDVIRKIQDAVFVLRQGQC